MKGTVCLVYRVVILAYMSLLLKGYGKSKKGCQSNNNK